MNSNGQSIRLNYFCSSVFENLGASHYYYGFGYEQNLGSRLAVSLEYNRGYSFDDYVNGNIVFPDGTGVQYSLNMPWTEFSYQSKYFFSDNDDGTAYLSMGIAYRNVKSEMQNVSYSGMGTSPIPQEATGTESLIPISLKLGYRGSIDGLFGDYFIGINYIPGGSSKNTGINSIDNYPLLDSENRTVDCYKSIAFTFGMAFGIGWAD